MTRCLLAVALLVPFGLAGVFAQERVDTEMLTRIRAEGLQRSRAQALFLTLTDDIGARLTGSPSHLRAAQWARDRFVEWGLQNAHLEPFEFGRGWSL